MNDIAKSLYTNNNNYPGTKRLKNDNNALALRQWNQSGSEGKGYKFACKYNYVYYLVLFKKK